MSTDGAAQGVTAERALETILGGAPAPTDDECLKVSEMAALIESRTVADCNTYGGTAEYAAKLALAALRRGADPAMVDLYRVCKDYAAGGPDYVQCLGELTGFQWGWAENAARRIHGLGEVPNPAIIVV